MWFPFVGIPEGVAQGLSAYRDLFCRSAGFAQVSRYVTGLLLSDNKTLQGIHAQQVWPDGAGTSCRAMHEAVFESGWDSEGLMPRHRELVSAHHQGRGREVIALDWTLLHHERGPQIYATQRGYDYVEQRPSTYQVLVTATIANRERADSLAVDVQEPNYQQQELAYLEMTAQSDATDLASARQRVMELLHYHKNHLQYRKRTEIAVEIVRQLELEGHFPKAHYAFDNGVLSLPLTQLIEQQGKHWVTGLECSRLIHWQGRWQRLEHVAHRLRTDHPQSFRGLTVTDAQGATQTLWVFSKTVRLKRYGRKRLVIIHDQQDLQDNPRYLLTDALHWEAKRILQVWQFRWPVEVFHECAKQTLGLESSQVRKEQAVQRHLRLTCVAYSLLQDTPAGGASSEAFAWVGDQPATSGQQRYTLARQALGQLLKIVQNLTAQGQSQEQILERLMPA